MSDLEADLDKATTRQRHHRLLRSIRREWIAAGYSRWHHLQGLAAEGDRTVLVGFHHVETGQTFASWLAGRDIYELEEALYRARRQP